MLYRKLTIRSKGELSKTDKLFLDIYQEDILIDVIIDGLGNVFRIPKKLLVERLVEYQKISKKK